jgi:hypothetical protein
VFLGPNYHVQISRLILADAIGVYTPCSFHLFGL